jgi:hypothetical protein
MEVSVLQRHFSRIGARARFTWQDRVRNSVTLDIAHDQLGEIFDIRASQQQRVEVDVLHLEPRQRHLLLMTHTETGAKHKFLCGHDERHWFVAAVPENRPVSTVQTAMEALKPTEVVLRQTRLKVRRKNWNRRRNEAFIRQGEWFFVPEPGLILNTNLVLSHEPLRRGGGKPHMVEFLYRSGGEVVYICPRKPNGLTQTQFNTFVSRNPAAKNWNWTSMSRNPSVYVKGRIRHADHATIDEHRISVRSDEPCGLPGLIEQEQAGAVI